MGRQYYNGSKKNVYARNWVYSAQDRDCWRALVNVALKLQDSQANCYFVAYTNITSTTYNTSTANITDDAVK